MMKMKKYVFLNLLIALMHHSYAYCNKENIYPQHEIHSLGTSAIKNSIPQVGFANLLEKFFFI